MHPLPISLIIPAASYFKRDHDFAIFISFVATCSNNLQNLGVHKPEPIKKIKKIRNENGDMVDDIPNIDIYYGRGIFPTIFNNKDIYEKASQILLNVDLVNNPDLLNNHNIALEVAAWHWISQKLNLYGLNVDIIADKLKMTINKTLFNNTFFTYENYLSRKGFNI